MRSDRPDAGAVLPVSLAQPQEDRARLVLGLKSDEEDGVGGFQVGVRRALAEHDLGSKEVRLLLRQRSSAEVDVVGAERYAREGAVGVGVLGGHPAARQDSRATGLGEATG